MGDCFAVSGLAYGSDGTPKVEVVVVLEVYTVAGRIVRLKTDRADGQRVNFAPTGVALRSIPQKTFLSEERCEARRH